MWLFKVTGIIWVVSIISFVVACIYTFATGYVPPDKHWIYKVLAGMFIAMFLSIFLSGLYGFYIIVASFAR